MFSAKQTIARQCCQMFSANPPKKFVELILPLLKTKIKTSSWSIFFVVSVAKCFRPNLKLQSVLPNVFGQTNNCSQCCQMFSAKQTITVSVAKCFWPNKQLQSVLLNVFVQPKAKNSLS
jgi:hypothetical protein